MTDAAKISTLIVDDEPIARAGLIRLLAEIEWIDIIGEAADGLTAVEMIDAQKPDLVFLDIQMPGLIGTDVLCRLRHRPLVVFTTAHSQHAVAAFELGALDYLLKPFSEKRLRAAVERVRAALGEPHSAFDRFGEAMSRVPMSRLFVRTGRSVVPIAVGDIARFEAVGDYTAVHVADTHHLLHVSLNQLEARLDPQRFLRIHRAHIVNLDRVTGFSRRVDAQLVAQMSDGAIVPVSRARAAKLRALVG
ncbi:MAG TPA: LytTR family DNA-binding domain-containing protein [Rudaea sp.]|jgi:two-component system LytT family response regulator|nr:LytTR family DNA-binding domain-containing protein [Rudaea sp.]